MKKILLIIVIILLQACESNVSSTTKASVPDQKAVPVNISSIITDDNKIKLTWGATTSVDSFTLYRKNISAFGNSVTVTTENVTSPYIDDTAIPNLDYIYWLVAVNNGQESAPSLNISVKIGIRHTVNSIVNSGGSVNQPSISVAPGSTGSFTITPDFGFDINMVTGCNGSLLGNTYTTAAITDACTVTVDFISNQIFSQNKYDSANLMRGGKLYDKWWIEKGISAPTDINPVWQYTATPNDGVASSGGQWSCNECHGWDYKGREGAYGDPNSLHYSGVSGFNNTSPNFSPESVYNFLTNGTVQVENGIKNFNAPVVSHSFLSTNKLNSTDIYDLTSFIIKLASIDPIAFIAGDANRGKDIFNNTALTGRSCASVGCHNAGNTINTDIIVALAQNNEPLFLHKVRMGSAGAVMPGGLDNGQAKDVLEYVKAGVNTIVIPNSNFSQTTYDALTNNDVAKGGLLYDKWWNVSTAAEPATTDTHPLWPATNATTGSDTWRCKECHGWDYRGKDGAYGAAGKHNTGIKGIVNFAGTTMQMQTADNIYSYLKVDTTHGFNDKFTDDEYYALTKFIMTIRDEAAQQKASFNFINDATLTTINGDATAGKTLYEENTTLRCAVCHGPDGKLLDFADHSATPGAHEFLNDIALENPWEFIHKIRFGQPASSMPATITLSPGNNFSTIKTAVDILAYAQTDLYKDIKRGGLLYDTWWNATNVKTVIPPTSRNQNWIASAGTSDITKVADVTTWRCSICHGWDYNGSAGAFSSGTTFYSGIKGLIDAKNLSETTLFDIIKNGPASRPDHAFGQYINDADITLLAQFILDNVEGIPPLSNLNAALASTNKTNGKTIFEGRSPGNCATCHGIEGKALPNAVINVIANNNAQKFIHKARYGHPGSYMVPLSTQFQGLSLAEAGDVLAYGKSIGTPAGSADYASADLVRGGRLFDEWWTEMKSSNPAVLPPADVNPLWENRSYNPDIIPIAERKTKPWRCNSCHAWDYKGIGIFTNGISSESGADNLLYKIALRRSAFAGNDIQLQNYIFDWIKNGDQSVGHKFGGTASSLLPSPMTDGDIWDLTRFLLEPNGLVNSIIKISSTGNVVAPNLTNGQGLFTGSFNSTVHCADCHGFNGKLQAHDIFAIAAPFSALNPEGNPWEFLHKVRFGQPGTAMPSLTGDGLNINDAYDILGYGQNEFNSRITP